MRVLVALSLSLSPEPQTPYFPHETIDYSALPLLKLRVSDCEYNFVPWLFKRVPVSPENFCFSLVHSNTADFSKPDVMWVSVPVPGALG